MALQDIIGELVRQGMSGQTQARMRTGAERAGGGMEALRDALMGQGGARSGGAPGGVPGGGLEDLLGGLLGGGSAPGGADPYGRPDPRVAERRGGPAGGGLEDLLGAVLGGGPAAPPQGRMAPSGAGQGGLGDLLGAILGGGAGAARGGAGGMGDLLGAMLGGGGSRGAAGGGAMAILASLAMGALKSYMAQGGRSAAAAVSPDQARALVSPQAERLVLAAMLSAAKADGQLDRRELAKLTEKAAEDGATPEERAFLDAELRRPIDIGGLAAQVDSPAMAAQVYAASVLAIEIDTEAERAYLRDLADALRLAPAAVAEIHRMTGAPDV